MFYKFARGFVNLLLRMLFRVRIYGNNALDNVDGCIVYANHTNYLDPVVVGCTAKRQVKFMAKKELFEIRILGYILNKLGTFPVRRGEADLTAVKTAMKILKNGEVLGIFPEGTRNKNANGKFLDAEPGLSMIAVKSRVPVIPVAILPKYKLFGTVTIVYGDPFYLDEYYQQKLTVEEHRGISNNLMERIRILMREKAVGGTGY
ncbi:MAG: Acyl-CoA:1-acyl-sn-glycerol-3-phosphate acyltransferase [Firmicutes bacterium]|nr:Acyl-CoA:1-acyl-sn-glycerol-3-phosphate acyltransferase [Bacillota bacterium]MDI6706380.1 lysophospholipid acyltransferase family protein [Bacillota bacterium]